MCRQVSALDVERVLACVGQHVFDFEIPGDGSDVPLLEKELLSLDVVDEETAEVVNDGDLLPIRRDVDQTNRRGLLHNRDWKAIVDEDFEDAAILTSNKKTFSLGRTTQWLDVLDGSLKHPLTL